MQNEKLKIAIIGHKQFPSRTGGIEVVVEELATRLAAMGDNVVCYDRYELDKTRHYPTGEYKSVKIKLCPTLSNSKINAMLASLTGTIKLLFYHPDVAHYHAIGPCAMIFLPHLFGIHTVATIHGLDWQRGKWGKFASTYLQFGEKMAVKYADDMIVLSEDMQKYFKDKYGRDTILIQNGITPIPEQTPNLIKKEYGLNTDNYILYLGRIVPEKKVDKLVDAYLKLHTDKKLVIAGTFDDGEYCRKIKEKIDGNPNIITPGFVDGKILEELYTNAYVFVLPSDVEGCSIALLEAMSCGSRILVSDIYENKIMIGKFGHTFAVNDEKDFEKKLNEILMENTPHRNEEEVEYVKEKYDWDKVAEKTREVYLKKR